MRFRYYGPLEPGNPLFQGRREQANTLLDACQEDVKAYQIVYGSRQSGKTSLLLNIMHRLPLEVLACWIDFQRLPNASTEEVLQFLADSISGKIREAEPDYPLWHRAGNDGFQEWLQRLPLRGRLVLLLEELGSLSRDTRIKLGNILRAIFNARFPNASNRIMVIFFGGIELFDMAAKEVSPLENVCIKIDLPDLSLEQTARLLQAGFQEGKTEDKQIDFDKLGQAIYKQVEGHPYLSQRLGELVLSRLLRKDSSSYPQVVGKLGGELLKHDDQYDRYFGNLYNTIEHYHLTEDCRRLLSKPLPHSSSTYNESMIRLRLLGVAKDQDEKWVVRNPLLKRGLKAWLAHTGKAKRSTLPSDLKEEPEMYLAYQNDLKVLIDRLISHTSMTNENARRAVIIHAGLGDLIPKLKLQGTAADAVPSIIWSLAAHGHVSEDVHALGLFLKGLTDPLYSGMDQQKYLQGFINRHQLLKQTFLLGKEA